VQARTLVLTEERVGVTPRGAVVVVLMRLRHQLADLSPADRACVAPLVAELAVLSGARR
jgi:hypothetical protein